MRLKSKPVTKLFTNIQVDGFDDSFSIEVRQAREGDNIKRADLVAEASMVIADNNLGTEIKQKINTPALQRFGVWLTLSACDIVDEDNNDKPWFNFNNGRLANQQEFERAWNNLPAPIAKAIYKKVLEVNPDWSNAQEDPEGEF